MSKFWRIVFPLCIIVGVAVGTSFVGCGDDADGDGDGGTPANPCEPDPCQGIANAVAGSCTAAGGSDFTCGCSEGLSWNAASNTCEEPPAQATYTNTTKAIFDAKCITCHPTLLQPDLSNYAGVFAASGQISAKVSPGGSMRIYLTDDEAQTIIDWIDAGAPE